MRRQNAIGIVTAIFINALLVSNVVAGKLFQNTSRQPEPAPVKAVAPIYPVIASASGVSGTVTVEVEIDQHGVVKLVRSVSGPKALQPAAEHSAGLWLFNTTDESTGKRVATLTFVFDLVPGDPPAVELMPSFFPPYRIEVRGTKPNFIHRVDSDPPMKRGKKPRNHAGAVGKI
jgi:hypothetical protein